MLALAFGLVHFRGIECARARRNLLRIEVVPVSVVQVAAETRFSSADKNKAKAVRKIEVAWYYSHARLLIWQTSFTVRQYFMVRGELNTVRHCHNYTYI